LPSRLFSERGFENVTVAQIADAANTSQEVRASVAQAAGGDPSADRQALRNWIPQAAGRLARGLQAAGRLPADNGFRPDGSPNREDAGPPLLTRERARSPHGR
jgi:hypothetical protein